MSYPCFWIERSSFVRVVNTSITVTSMLFLNRNWQGRETFLKDIITKITQQTKGKFEPVSRISLFVSITVALLVHSLNTELYPRLKILRTQTFAVILLRYRLPASMPESKMFSTWTVSENAEESQLLVISVL